MIYTASDSLEEPEVILEIGFLEEIQLLKIVLQLISVPSGVRQEHEVVLDLYLLLRIEEEFTVSF